MALRKSKLSQIPRPNKYLAFGYIHEREKLNKLCVPEMIKYLCLVYFNPTDTYNHNECDKQIEINGQSIIEPINSTQIHNVYLNNIVSSGVHVRGILI